MRHDDGAACMDCGASAPPLSRPGVKVMVMRGRPSGLMKQYGVAQDAVCVHGALLANLIAL